MIGFYAGDEVGLFLKTLSEAVGRTDWKVKVDPSELKTLRKSHPAKLMLATYLKTYYSRGNTRISKVLHMGHANLVGRCHIVIMDNRDLNRMYETISRYLDK